jgi:hypothetical protein
MHKGIKYIYTIYREDIANHLGITKYALRRRLYRLNQKRTEQGLKPLNLRNFWELLEFLETQP